MSHPPIGLVFLFSSVAVARLRLLDVELAEQQTAEMEAMESAKKFCWKHRMKIGLGAVAVAGGVALYYYLNHQEESHPDNQSREGQRPTSDLPSPSSGEEEMKSPSKDFQSRRSPPESDSERENLDEQRLLVAVNELYGFSLVYFLPNVRSRLKDLIDVSETIQRLKDLKNDHSDESRDMKVSLWNNIKISSFTTLLATVYAISAVSVLLHVQMHILVRDTVKITSSGPASILCPVLWLTSSSLRTGEQRPPR
jgi:hypothetical protein